MSLVRKKSSPAVAHPFVKQSIASRKQLVAAHRVVALPTVAMLHLLLAACGRGDGGHGIQADDPEARLGPRTHASGNASSPIERLENDKPPPPVGSTMGIESTPDVPVSLAAPAPPKPPPKPVLGKPHGIEPPKKPYPLGGDYMLVIPRPSPTGAKPA